VKQTRPTKEGKKMSPVQGNSGNQIKILSELKSTHYTDKEGRTVIRLD
jgi:hypothetical protein